MEKRMIKNSYIRIYGWHHYQNFVVVPLIILILSAITPFSSQAQTKTTTPLLAPTPQIVTPPVSKATTGVAVKQLVVEGAQRIEPASVLDQLGLKIGDLINQDVVNDSIKRLFATGLFSDVTINLQGQVLVVKVQENPIINRIAFEGNDALKDEVLTSEIQLRPRVVYTRGRVQEDVQRILDLYRRQGRFATKVVPKIIQLEQNRVDLVFEITENKKTGISKVSIIGNHYFSDSALEDVVNTKVSRWYTFFSDNDTYDPEKLTFDKELLRRYYLAHGFADFRVVSAVAELDEAQENFYITFTIEEGERYRMGGVKVSSEIKDLNPELLSSVVKIEKDDWYDADKVNKTVDDLTKSANNQGFPFVNIRPKVDRKVAEKIIDIDFSVQNAQKIYVDRIEVRGNVRTLDKVIRRELSLVEGDPYNANKLSESRTSVNNLGYFKKVDVSNTPAATPDHTNVFVDVEEQSTGELSLGAGYSTTDGILGQIALRERNLMGRGQDLRLGLGLAQKRQSIDLSFTEPYFLEKDLAAGFDVFHIRRNNQDTSSYDSSRTGGGLRLGYDIADHLRQTLRYKISSENVQNIDSTASEYIKDDEGTYLLSTLGQTLSYDRRNSRVDPTDGGVISYGIDYTGVGGDFQFVTNKIDGAYYFPVYDQVTLKTATSLSMINNFGDNMRVDDRLFLGGDSLRGFANGGVGPRDISTDDALGGMKSASATIELLFPIGLPEEYGIRGTAFTDAGTLYDLEDSGANIVDSNSVRVGSGVGMSWRSPFGPIRIDFAKALVKESYDKTEVFRVNFGTRF